MSPPCTGRGKTGSALRDAGPSRLGFWGNFWSPLQATKPPSGWSFAASPRTAARRSPGHLTKDGVTGNYPAQRPVYGSHFDCLARRHSRESRSVAYAESTFAALLPTLSNSRAKKRRLVTRWEPITEKGCTPQVATGETRQTHYVREKVLCKHEIILEPNPC